MKKGNISSPKKYFLITIFSILGFSFSVLSFAQDGSDTGGFSIGVRIGSTVGNFSNQQPQNSIIMGLTSGIFAKYNINDNMGLQLECLYTQEGGRLLTFDVPYFLSADSWYDIRVHNQRLILHNINIPFLFQYGFDFSQFKLTASIGPEFGYLVKAVSNSESTVFTEVGSFHTYTDHEDVTSNIERYYLAGTAGIGLKIPTGNMNLLIDGRYRYAFTSSYYSYSYVGIPQIAGDLQLRTVSLTIGLEF